MSRTRKYWVKSEKLLISDYLWPRNWQLHGVEPNILFKNHEFILTLQLMSNIQHSSSFSLIPHLYLHSPGENLCSQWPQYSKQLPNYNPNATSAKSLLRFIWSFILRIQPLKVQSAHKYRATSYLNSFLCMWWCYAFNTHLEPLVFVLCQF